MKTKFLSTHYFIPEELLLVLVFSFKRLSAQFCYSLLNQNRKCLETIIKIDITMHLFQLLFNNRDDFSYNHILPVIQKFKNQLQYIFFFQVSLYQQFQFEEHCSICFSSGCFNLIDFNLCQRKISFCQQHTFFIFH